MLKTNEALKWAFLNEEELEIYLRYIAERYDEWLEDSDSFFERFLIYALQVI